MLRLLSGRTHEVLTALAVTNIATGQESLHVEKTRVEIVKLSEEEIANYIATGEPFDKAGAYGIQGIAGRFAARINGCYFNVLGMPLSRLWTTLHELGWKESSKPDERAAKENGGHPGRRHSSAITIFPTSNPKKNLNVPLLLFFGRHGRWRRRWSSGRRIRRRIRRGRARMRAVHPILKAADAFAKPAHHLGNFLAPEKQHDNRQHD